MYLKGKDNCRTVREVRASLASVIKASEPTIVLNAHEPCALVIPLGKVPWRCRPDEQAQFNTRTRRLLYRALVFLEKENEVHERLSKKNQRTLIK